LVAGAEQAVMGLRVVVAAVAGVAVPGRWPGQEAEEEESEAAAEEEVVVVRAGQLVAVAGAPAGRAVAPAGHPPEQRPSEPALRLAQRPALAGGRR
jgi:hypothetical protein